MNESEGKDFGSLLQDLADTKPTDVKGEDIMPWLIANALNKEERAGEILAMVLADFLYKGDLPQNAADFLAYKLEEMARNPGFAAEFFSAKGANTLNRSKTVRKVEERMIELVNDGVSERRASQIVEVESGAKSETARKSHRRAVERARSRMYQEEAIRSARTLAALLHIASIKGGPSDL